MMGLRLAALVFLGGLTAGVRADTFRIEEVPQGPLVELAWLESPITFPCPLQARVVGGTLELHGSVPNGTIREYALKIARRHTSLPLVDRLNIHPGVTGWPDTPGDPKALAQEAEAALAAAFGQEARSIRVVVTSRGDVVLEGRASSLENKVRVSKQLQGLRGCRRVRNHLVVASLTPSKPPVGHRVVTRTGSNPLPLPPRWRARTRPTPKVAPTDFARSRPLRGGVKKDNRPPSSFSLQRPSPSSLPTVALTGGEVRPSRKTPAQQKPAVKSASLPVTGPSATTTREPSRIPRARIAAPRIRVAPVPAFSARALPRLRQRIAAVCGPWAQDVQVLAEKDRIHVVVYVYNEGTLGTLKGRIQELPEVQQPNVSLEMKLIR